MNKREDYEIKLKSTFSELKKVYLDFYDENSAGFLPLEKEFLELLVDMSLLLLRKERSQTSFK
jgi:hypothetical protein